MYAKPEKSVITCFSQGNIISKQDFYLFKTNKKKIVIFSLTTPPLYPLQEKYVIDFVCIHS